MNNCTYCGRENPPEATHCWECGTEIPQIVAPPIPSIPPIPPVLIVSEPHPLREPLKISERQLRIAEVWIVCAVAVGGSVFSAIGLFTGARPHRTGMYGNFSSAYMLLHEATALALLWWVLARRQISLLSWLLPLRARDIGESILLWIGQTIAHTVCYYALYAVGFAHNNLNAQFHSVTNQLFGPSLALGAFAIAIFNPFFEELIVRAYLMTEVKALTGSAAKAVMVSVLLQSVYHLYQGGAAAVSISVLFLISSIYYARTGRIQAPILAHFYIDFSATLVAFAHSA